MRSSNSFLIHLLVLLGLTAMPLSGIAQTITIDNGVVGPGHLDVSVDAYGSYGNWNAGGFWDDNFEPSDAGSSQPTFSAGFRIFGDGGKALLSDLPEWNVLLASTWIRITTSFLPTGTDTVNSSFVVSDLNGPLLSFEVTQTVSGPAAGIAVLEQNYEITNVSGNPIDFTMNRVLDGDLVWAAMPLFTDDHVGATDQLDFIFMHEPMSTSQAMALRAGPNGIPNTYYWGAKNLHEPTGGPSAFGFGSDTIVWDNDGLPETWRNYIAFIGYDTAGDSGPGNPNDTTGESDGSVGLDWEISLDTDESTTVNVRTIYGALEFCIKGDVNGDGVVNFLDIQPFVDVLNTGSYQCEADVDDDGVVDFLDIQPFVDLLK